MRERGSAAEAKWRQLVSEQQASGKIVAEFCREREVPESQMFSWKKRLREAEAAKFVEVAVETTAETGEGSVVSGGAIEVRLSRGCSVVVEPGFDARHLRALLAVLEGAA